MDPKSLLMPGLHLIQLLLSLSGAIHSYIAITNLRQYEATTKKLAKWSSTVEHELHKTRTTQTTGALAILLSALTSLLLIFHAQLHLPYWLKTVLSPVMLVVVLLARGHVKNYWTPYKDSRGKEKGGVKVDLPNLEEYNAAARATEELLKVLEYLEYSWVGTSLFAGMKGYT